MVNDYITPHDDMRCLSSRVVVARTDLPSGPGQPLRPFLITTLMPLRSDAYEVSPV